MGQRTLPPDQPKTPRSPLDHGCRAEVDQLGEEQVNEAVRAAEAHAEYLHEYGQPGSDRRARIDEAARERLRYQGIAVDGTPEQLHREEEPLGRRVPEPLEASREGVER